MGGTGWAAGPEPGRHAGPGWYPDPVGRGRLRWWTGAAWTSWTSRLVLPAPRWARRLVVPAAVLAVAAGVASAVCSWVGRAHLGGTYRACGGTHSPLVEAGAVLLAVAVLAAVAGIGPVVRVLQGADGPLRRLATAAAVAVPLAVAAGVVGAAASALSYVCLF